MPSKSSLKKYSPVKCIQTFVNVTHTMFMRKPIIIIVCPFIVLAWKTRALGAVATGSIKAYEQDITVVITEIINKVRW